MLKFLKKKDIFYFFIVYLVSYQTPNQKINNSGMERGEYKMP